MENSVFIIHARSTAYTFLYFTESQNHRMVEAGRDLWGSPCPRPAPAGHLEPPAQDRVRRALEWLQGWRLRTQKSPDHVKHLIFTWNKLKSYKLESLIAIRSNVQIMSTVGDKKPWSLFFFSFFPRYSRIHFFLQVAYRHTKLIQISPTPKRISFDFVLSIKIYAWKSASQNISFVY